MHLSGGDLSIFFSSSLHFTLSVACPLGVFRLPPPPHHSLRARNRGGGVKNKKSVHCAFVPPTHKRSWFEGSENDEKVEEKTNLAGFARKTSRRQRSASAL